MTRKLWSTHSQQMEKAGVEIRSGSDIWSFCLRAGLLRGGFAVIFDIDDFRSINTRQGRDAGDALLDNLWRRLLNALPPAAFGIRWSGNAFLLVLNVPDQSFRTFIREAMKPHQAREQTTYCSAGSARVETPSSLADCLELSMRTDKALTLAKKRGGNLALMYEGPDRYEVLFCGAPSRRVYEPFVRTKYLEKESR